jgi:hypothetical protein
MTTVKDLTIVAFDIKAQEERAFEFKVSQSMTLSELEDFMIDELEKKYNTLFELLHFELS